MKEKKSIFRRTAVSLAMVAVFLVVLWLLQLLLMPKYMTEMKEGAMIAEYYRDTPDHSVIFVGDCEVYESYSPVVLWEEYGINAYIRGSAQQLIWQSYYLMEDTLRYETPACFVFNIQSVQYPEPQKEAYNRMTLDGMKWGLPKLRAIRASMCADESFASYLFPILRYHERITSLGKEDLTYLFRRDTVTHNGYLMNVGIDPYKGSKTPIPLSDYTLSPTVIDYLDKMVALCEAHGVRLIFVKAPSISETWWDEWEEQIVDYAAKNNVPYYNFLNLRDEVGLDFETDTYDHGKHLNLSGAEKMSRYFGKILREEFEIPDERDNDALKAAWEEKSRLYRKEKAKLLTGQP